MFQIVDEAVYCDDPMEYLEYGFGQVLSFDSLMKNSGVYAEIFSEGSPALKETLKQLWRCGVKTLGCCIGHEAVHVYTKDGWFGRQIAIGEETYRLNSDSGHFHNYEIQAESHAYLAFDPGPLGDRKAIAKKIESSMKALSPELPLFVDSGRKNNIVTICLEELVPEQVREKFFLSLLDVIEKQILPQRSSNQMITTSQKPSLSSQIQGASEKAGNPTPSSKTKSLNIGR